MEVYMTQQMSSWTTTKEISRLTLQGFLTYHTGSLKLANRMQHQAFISSISPSDYDLGGGLFGLLERPVRCVAGLVECACGAPIDARRWHWPVSLQGKLELT